MEKIEILAQPLLDAVGLSADELKSLTEGKDLKEASEAIFARLGDRFAEVRQREGKAQYNRGIKEKGKAAESAMAPIFERFEIDINDFDTFESGVQELTKKLEQVGNQTDSANLTTEQITSHATYQALQRKLDAANEARKNLQAEYEGFKTDIHTRSVLSAARSATAQFLEENNAVKGNATYDKVAEFFLATVDPSRIGLNDGKPVWLDEDGQPLTDKLGNPVSWGQGVRDRYELGFNVADPGKGGSGAPAGSGGKGGGGGLVVRSRDEAQRLLQQHQGDKAMTAKINNAYSEYLDSQG